MPEIISKILVFIFGAVIGSFLNVCIYRMPRGESVVWPRSHCPHCRKKIPGYDNIPFLSYLILGGRCRFCRMRISWRYPLVEFLTAAVLVLLFNRFGFSYDFFIYSIFGSGLIVATFVDFAQRIIPDEISIGGMILGFILVSVKGFSLSPLRFSFRPMFNSFMGIIVGAGIIYIISFFFDLVYFRLLKKPPVQGETTSMGAGDIKFLAMIGAFLGWQKAIFTFFAAPFLGLILGLLNLIFKKDRLIPYGPFLALAALIALWWADKIAIFLIRGL